jgi:hypothetical protein
VDANVYLLHIPITTMLWQAMKEEGLLRKDAPVPG